MRLCLVGLLLWAVVAASAAQSPTPPPETTPEATPEVLLINPLTKGEDLPPPIRITLPDNWGSAHDGLVFEDIGEVRVLPFAVYGGPLPQGGDGYIVLLWGFPATMGSNPLQPREPNLYIDGLRYLRIVLLEVGCNVGTDFQYDDYTIGGLPASGTQFAAVDCPTTTDTRGWFAGLNVDDVNFIFYTYAEPLAAMDGQEAFFQAILDTVEFDVASLFDRLEATPEATPDVTPSPTSVP